MDGFDFLKGEVEIKSFISKNKFQVVDFSMIVGI